MFLFVIFGSFVMDINLMGNMVIDGEMVDFGMIDVIGFGNIVLEWGIGGMIGNVDLMMDIFNLVIGVNNVWDIIYMFDNIVIGGFDMGVGVFGFNWDVVFVDLI